MACLLTKVTVWCENKCWVLAQLDSVCERDLITIWFLVQLRRMTAFWSSVYVKYHLYDYMICSYEYDTHGF